MVQIKISILKYKIVAYKYAWVYLGSAILFNQNKNKMLNKSLFIDEFKEDMKSHKVKFINEKKDRVTVLHIENLTKLLY